MPAPGTPVASTITSMRGSAISASALSVIKVGALLVRVVERSGGVSSLRPAGGLELAARARDVEIGDAGDMQPARQPRLRQEHGAEFAGADHADGDRLAGRFAFEQFCVEVHRCTPLLERDRNTGVRWRQAAPERAGSYWQRARETKVSVWQPGAAVASGQIDLRRANLGGRHVDAAAGVEAFALAHGIGRGHAVGRAVRRDLAFLVTVDHAGGRDPRDRAGGILGAFDGRLGGNAGFMAEILHLRAGILEAGADLGGLLVEPVRDIAEEAASSARGAASARSCASASEAASRMAPAPTQASSKEAARSSGVNIRNAMGAHIRPD